MAHRALYKCVPCRCHYRICNLYVLCSTLLEYIAWMLSHRQVCFVQNKLARVVIDRVPCLEMVRFVNSGTEACLSVLRLMRAFTGRDKVHLKCMVPMKLHALKITLCAL